jgi:hypothetical protein
LLQLLAYSVQGLLLVLCCARQMPCCLWCLLLLLLPWLVPWLLARRLLWLHALLLPLLHCWGQQDASALLVQGPAAAAAAELAQRAPSLAAGLQQWGWLLQAWVAVLQGLQAFVEPLPQPWRHQQQVQQPRPLLLLLLPCFQQSLLLWLHGCSVLQGQQGLQVRQLVLCSQHGCGGVHRTASAWLLVQQLRV